ncbi:type II toxin-antitoxin system ParD family antitoxin [Tardiphaga sp.]|uniref:ribbon-helix-helix domain-containing protein n=1 Tax=Tardiphaga sp. TaxID=1926292 RepID=UPI002638BEF1|nr:type II toxin-antitoxin system ParD family antitoxin [Tardiphaga sp.]MDB5617626.1 addiction module antidote protein [Tardiphaga sp.]
MRTSKPISVTLGKQQASVDRRLASGHYDSASEVVRAGIRAPDREEAMLDGMIREKVLAALSSPGPDLPAEEVFARLRAHHDEQVKSGPAMRLCR